MTVREYLRNKWRIEYEGDASPILQSEILSEEYFHEERETMLKTDQHTLVKSYGQMAITDLTEFEVFEKWRDSNPQAEYDMELRTKSTGVNWRPFAEYIKCETL